MASRLYLVPVIGTGTRQEPRRAKYFSDFTRDTLPSSWMDFGLEPVMLVGADVTNDQHLSISANIDVVSIPANIDATISALALTQVQNALEGMNIPANWVTTAMTYRFVLRVVVGMFQFAQRYQGLGGGRLFGTGISLGTQFNQLPAAVRSRLIETAESFGYDTSSLSGNSTIRQILKFLGDQWGSKSIVLGGITI